MVKQKENVMKNLIFIIALIAISFNTFAIDSLKTYESVKVKVSWVDQIGTPAEKHAEYLKRKKIYADYTAKGYQFSKIVKSKDGLFLEFIK